MKCRPLHGLSTTDPATKPVQLPTTLVKLIHATRCLLKLQPNSTCSFSQTAKYHIHTRTCDSSTNNECILKILKGEQKITLTHEHVTVQLTVNAY